MHPARGRQTDHVSEADLGAFDLSIACLAAQVRRDLKLLVPHVHWTSGHWDDEMGGLAWNEIQNVPRHISGLANFLIRTYLKEKGVIA